MAREFYLLNSKGASFDLMSSSGFFHAPEGLGFQNTQSFLRTGTFYKQVDSYEAQRQVSGEMVFKNYTDFQTFALFIAYQPLTLVYKPINTEYKLDCYVAKFDKSEIDHTNNRLICPITFAATSKWYYLRSALSAVPSGDDGKLYPYSYNYTYYDSQTGVIEATNNSPIEAPCILYIRGYCVNPTWVLSVNNTQLMSGAVTGTIYDGYQLVINSKDDSLEIATYTNQNAYYENMYQNADITKENFLYLPSGDFKITLSDDSGASVTAYLEILEQYDTI